MRVTSEESETTEEVGLGARSNMKELTKHLMEA